MKRPTENDTLLAIRDAAAPKSAYIRDVFRRRGWSTSSAIVLRRLEVLEGQGLVERSPFAFGGYGYEWTLTSAGLDAIAELDSRRALVA